MIHVRFKGRMYDFNIRYLREDANDREIKAAVARELAITADDLIGHVVVRRPTGTIIVRPELVYA